MAKTLLQGVNAVLKKAKVLDAQGELSSTTDSARQMFIDTAILSINEIIDEIYDGLPWSKPTQLREGTITLVQNQQHYALRSDLETLRSEYNLIAPAHSHRIYILGDDGYWQIVNGDLELDDTGQPNWCAIRPTDGRLFMDRKPDSNAAGRIYTYRYDRELSLDGDSDAYPFGDAAWRASVEASAEKWKFHMHREGSESLMTKAIARAVRKVRKLPKRQSYRERQGGINPTDPMSDATSNS